MPKQLSLFQDKCATIAAGTIQPERIGEGDTYEAVFIRAPAILSAGPSVEVLATIYAEPHHSARRQIEEERKSVRDLAHEESGQERKKQRLNSDERLSEVIETSPGAGERGELEGNILATAFHPELTTDTRWHRQEHADRDVLGSLQICVFFVSTSNPALTAEVMPVEMPGGADVILIDVLTTRGLGKDRSAGDGRSLMVPPGGRLHWRPEVLAWFHLLACPVESLSLLLLLFRSFLVR
eukprot:gene863-962_t